MGNTKTPIRWKQFALSAVLMGMASFAHAITVVSGSTVVFSYDETKLGLFSGPVSVSGDTLTFNPTNFVNNGSILVNSTINVLVTPKTGWLFSSADFQESGLYSQSAANKVAIGGQLRIFDPANPPAELTPSITNPVFQFPVTDQAWSASINQDLSLFSAAPSLNVTIENLLIAYPTNKISKNLVELTIVTSPVPEVETWAMMLAGLGLIGLQLRRRSGGGARAIR